MRRTLIAVTLLVGCQSQEAELLRDAQNAVARRMKDPGSAQFADMEGCAVDGMVTGTVNAKNSFGAYTGARSFVYERGRVWLSEDDGLPALADALDRCFGNKQGTSRAELANIAGGEPNLSD